MAHGTTNSALGQGYRNVRPSAWLVVRHDIRLSHGATGCGLNCPLFIWQCRRTMGGSVCVHVWYCHCGVWGSQGLLFKVNGVSSTAPAYSALSSVMLLLCGLFLAAWLSTVGLSIIRRFPGLTRRIKRLRLCRRFTRDVPVVQHDGQPASQCAVPGSSCTTAPTHTVNPLHDSDYQRGVQPALAGRRIPVPPSVYGVVDATAANLLYKSSRYSGAVVMN